MEGESSLFSGWLLSYSQSNSLPFLWQKIEKLTTRSDEKHSAALRGFEPGSFKNQSNAPTTDSEATTGTAWEFSWIPRAALCFSSDPAVISSISVGEKRERIWLGHTVVFATLKFTARSIFIKILFCLFIFFFLHACYVHASCLISNILPDNQPCGET